MNGITIVGGVYHESCIWPEWNQIVGSGGRAAAAISGHVEQVRLYSYLKPELNDLFQPSAAVYGFQFEPSIGKQGISFEYVHCLSTPIVHPAPELIQMNSPIQVSDEVVLRFGMLEGTAVVTAGRCVYDPQSPISPERFAANGSQAIRSRCRQISLARSCGICRHNGASNSAERDFVEAVFHGGQYSTGTGLPCWTIFQFGTALAD
jgi:hypothetical protein